jgi:hypothetical protein
MTRQFRSIALTAFVAALSSIGTSATQAKQQCSAAMPSDPHGAWWSYRLIDGRKCWYEGKPGLSKLLLEWPGGRFGQPASDEEAASAVPEKRPNLPASQAQVPHSTPKDTDTFEARWANIGLRAPPEDTTSGSEVDDGSPLTKADRLPSPYLNSGRAKVTR